MAILDSNIVNITLPEMTKTFHTSIDTISWVANTYNVAFVSCLLIADVWRISLVARSYILLVYWDFLLVRLCVV